MKRIGRAALTCSFALLAISSCRKVEENQEELTHDVLVNKLLEYNPAPGQFINKAPGNIESARSILNSESGLVSLGAWGGYAVYGFPQQVPNRSGKRDIYIAGNALNNFAEPGVIWVMEDTNKNGIADDVWYEISGSETNKAGYVRNYEVSYERPASSSDDVRWIDNNGKSGYVKHNGFHSQAYYPEQLPAKQTFRGTLLPSGNLDMSVPSNILSRPFEYGYGDNQAEGDEIDIDDAVDAGGRPVQLKGVDFIKVQTGVLADMGWLGELSTEITAIKGLNVPL